MISSKVIRYHLFIEGIEIPAQSIQIQNSSGKGCTLSASIPPHPMCYKLIRGMKVWVYKEVAGKLPVLRFYGILMNKVYSKSSTSRDLRIECISPDGRLNVLRMAELSKGSISSTGAMDYRFIKTLDAYKNKQELDRAVDSIIGETGWYDKNKEYMDFIINHQKELGGGLANGSYTVFKQKLEDIANTYEHDSGVGNPVIKGKPKASKDFMKKREDLFSIPGIGGDLKQLCNGKETTEAIKNLYNMYAAVGLYNNAETLRRNAEISAKLLAAGKVIPAYHMVLGAAVLPTDDATKLFATDVKISGNKEAVTYVDTAIDVQKTMSELSVSSLYLRSLKANQGDYINAIKDIIKAAFYNLPGLVKSEWTSFKWDEALYSLPIVAPEYFRNMLSKNTLTTEVTLKPLSVMFKDIIDNIMNNSPAGVSVYTIINQILNALFYKVSINHTQMKHGIMLHPEMSSYFPPTQNVIFPSMYSSIMYNGNDWANPTRTYMVFQPYMATNAVNSFLSPSEGASSSLIIAPTDDPNIRNISQKYVSASNAWKEAKDNSKSSSGEPLDIISPENQEQAAMVASTAWQLMHNTHTLEEELCGVYANIAEFPQGYRLQESCAGQATMADWYHSMARYGTRMCSVTGGDELDNLIVGMPTLIIDGVYSIYGVVEDLSIMVDASGAIQTQVTVSMPRMILNNQFDSISEGGLWLGCEEGKAWNIGKAYEDMFGKGALSVFDKCKESFVKGDISVPPVSKSFSPTCNMRICVAQLTNRFADAVDKQKFVDEFRNVKEESTTLDNMFTLIHSIRKDTVRMYKEGISGSGVYTIALPDDANSGYYKSYINLDIDLTGEDYVNVWDDINTYAALSEWNEMLTKLDKGTISPTELVQFLEALRDQQFILSSSLREKMLEAVNSFNEEDRLTPSQDMALLNYLLDSSNNEKFKKMQQIFGETFTPEESARIDKANIARRNLNNSTIHSKTYDIYDKSQDVEHLQAALEGSGSIFNFGKHTQTLRDIVKKYNNDISDRDLEKNLIDLSENILDTLKKEIKQEQEELGELYTEQFLLDEQIAKTILPTRKTAMETTKTKVNNELNKLLDEGTVLDKAIEYVNKHPEQYGYDNFEQWVNDSDVSYKEYTEFGNRKKELNVLETKTFDLLYKQGGTDAVLKKGGKATLEYLNRKKEEVSSKCDEKKAELIKLENDYEEHRKLVEDRSIIRNAEILKTSEETIAQAASAFENVPLIKQFNKIKKEQDIYVQNQLSQIHSNNLNNEREARKAMVEAVAKGDMSSFVDDEILISNLKKEGKIVSDDEAWERIKGSKEYKKYTQELQELTPRVKELWEEYGSPNRN